MAAFEATSRVTVRPLNGLSFIDFRTARLPYDRPQMDDFDPRDFREPKSPIKLWMAYFNLIRTIFGAGVLGLPLAISQVGIVLGPLMAIATGFLIIHTHLMLLGSLNEISRQLKIPYISYRYGFRLAILHGPPCLEFIGNYGPTIIATFMFLSQFGICTVFVTFTSDSLRDIMDWKNNKPAMLVLLLPYMLLEFFMKSLKIVSYVSMFGNFLNLIGLILVLYLIFDDPHGEMVLAQGDPLSVFFAFGTYLFNLSAVGVMLSIDKALKDPKILTKQFGIISIGIMIPTIFTTIFGCLGYWSFGSMEENILRSLPFDSLISMTAIGLYLIAVAFAFPIQCYPGIQIVVEVIKNRHVYDTPSDHTLWLIETISRPLFVLATFSVCFAIPFQGPFVAFVGNMCTTQLALVFPALMEICLLYPNDYGKYKVYLIKDLAIIFLGLASFVFGVILCGNLIYIRFMSTFSPNNSEYF